MKRLGCVMLLALLGGEAAAQVDEARKARCYQLAEHAEYYLTRFKEGSGGPNMTVLGARIDCDKGRYDQGIRALEKELRDQRISIPPPPG
ncbi:MAG: hypothetical protein KIT25_05905 [Enhydrobacter sp.]|nr:MAG: hypothetical protein KIT25_05905 [Enhydrobacter sp.]